MAKEKPLPQVTRAQLVKRLVTMAEQIQEMLDIVMPESPDGCPHPPHLIEHEESMDDEQHPYRCGACGKVQDEPFYPEE